MTISLEAISFNHDPASATRDALTIRKNETEDIAVPEWTRGITRPEDSRAAYTISQISTNSLTIKAQFRRQAGDPMSVEIHALGRQGNVLGDVRPRTVRFVNDLSDFELFELDSPSQNPGVRVSDIGWDWFVAGTLRQTTEHRIYTLLDNPKEPWGQPGSPFQLPWTEVLEHACRQAEGARSANEAAAMLTRWVFSLGQDKLRYNDYGSGSSTFVVGGTRTFRCTMFLQALAEGAGKTGRVNCTDCATILSSFANILGCDLTQSRIGGRGDIQTNRIQKIGFDSTIRQDFGFHEVAWKFPLEGAASLYDCCLRFDGDADPTDDIFAPELGINLPFGSRRNGYYFRLVAPTAMADLGELRGTRLRRKIEGQTTTPITLDPEERRRLEREHGFSEWRGTPAPTQVCHPQYKKQVVTSEAASAPERHLFLKNFSLNKGSKSFAGWTPGNVKSFAAEPDLLRVTDGVWTSNGCSGATLRVLQYECSSIAAARLFLLTLLGEFNLPGIKRRPFFVVDGKQVKIGDVAFAGPDDLVLLFARANNVVFIQNTGQGLVSVSPFAQTMDAEMTSGPDSKNGRPIEMKHFDIADKQIRVGDEVRIHTNGIQLTKEKQTLFKFFAPAGEIFLQGKDLLYRCETPGEQSVTVLLHKPGGETAQQVLRLFAEQPAASQEGDCHEMKEPNIKEQCVMPDIMGIWSSIRPRNNGADASADMTVDGYFEIRTRDAATGDITGFYWGPGVRNAPREMTGRVTFNAADAYDITLSHPVGERVTRHYYGQLVARDNNDDFGVQIVAGKYSDNVDETVVSGPTAAPLGGSSGGQDNGTWVATKP